MQFNFSWDSSVSNAPSAFKAAVVAAGQQLASYFADNITINIAVGWGEANGAAIAGGSLQGKGVFAATPITYDNFAAALAASAASADDKSTVAALNWLSLPQGDRPLTIASAESKALGLTNGAATGIDGSIGFSDQVIWDFDPSNGIGAGSYDFYAAVYKELTHAMGRVNEGAVSPLSLFSFTGNGVMVAATSPSSYFSLDGGATNLAAFSAVGDTSDFSLSSGADPFGQLSPSTATPISTLDLRTMDVLGYTLSLEGLAKVYSLNYMNVAASNQAVTGTVGGDLIVLFGVNETVTAGPGNDTIVGTASFAQGASATLDTSVYSGGAAQYAITLSNGIATVSDAVAGRDGVDTLTGIQHLKFTDYTVVLDLHSAQDQLVYELYQAAFARTPDNGGFRFWAAAADAQNLNAIALADAFMGASEFSAKYGTSLSDTGYVQAIYANVLQRAPDAAGLAYWVNNLATGEARDQLLVDFANSQEMTALIGAHTANGYWTT